MPRQPGRSAEETQELILEAGGRVLTDLVAGGAPVVLLSVSDVLRRANEIMSETHPGSAKLTTGAVANAFGGKAALSEKVLAKVLTRFLGPSVAGSVLADQVGRLEEYGGPLEVLDALSDADLANMVESNPESTRVWLLALASNRSGNLAEITAEVYRAFDGLLIPEYQEIANRARRRLRPGFEWRDLAAAFTAIAEGFALRHIGDESSLNNLRRVAREARRAVWEAMTEPV